MKEYDAWGIAAVVVSLNLLETLLPCFVRHTSSESDAIDEIDLSARLSCRGTIAEPQDSFCVYRIDGNDPFFYG